MLDQVFRSKRVLERLRSGVLGSALEILASRLHGAGYAAQVIQKYSRAVGHFGYWMEAEGMVSSAVNHGAVDRFLQEHLPKCRCPVACREHLSLVRPALAHLLDVLGVERGAERRPPTPPQHGILGSFETYLRDVRGLVATTCAQYISRAAAFLDATYEGAAIDLARLGPGDVVDYLTARAAHLKPGTLKQEAVVVRGFLRFLQLGGLCAPHLTEAVPAVPRWRLAHLPKVLTDEQVQRLLGSFDRSTAIGRRGYAMALCLVCLGLRSAEVARLSLGDIDWRNGTVRLVGSKGRRDRILPLPPEVGRAIVAYLRHGRPATAERRIFVRHRIPQGRQIDSRVVQGTIRRAFQSAGVAAPRGAHVLRHTAATRLLRSGASLKEIADILGHRSLDTTAIYAKVDLGPLRQVALPWPEVPS